MSCLVMSITRDRDAAPDQDAASFLPVFARSGRHLCGEAPPWSSESTSPELVGSAIIAS